MIMMMKALSNMAAPKVARSQHVEATLHPSGNHDDDGRAH